MSDFGTFSAVVDSVILRTGRRDRLQDVISYTRATLRECSVLAFFKRDLTEASLTVDAVPFLWTVPPLMRQLVVIEYPFTTLHGDPVRPKEMALSRRKADDVYYYYQAGNTIVMSDLSVGNAVKVAYYNYTAPFKYIALEADRPATYNLDTSVWTYQAAYQATALLQEQARDLVSNWLTFHWFDVIIEGVLAKLYKVTVDDRANAAYALYKSMQKDIVKGEASVQVPE